MDFVWPQLSLARESRGFAIVNDPPRITWTHAEGLLVLIIQTMARIPSYFCLPGSKIRQRINNLLLKLWADALVGDEISTEICISFLESKHLQRLRVSRLFLRPLPRSIIFNLIGN